MGKGFWDRMKDAAEAVGGAVAAPVGLAVDLAQAPFTDDEYGGLTDTLFRATLKHGGRFASAIGGDEGVIGSGVGLVPEGVRRAPGQALRALNTVYKETIDEPFSTLMTVGSLADAPGGGGMAGLFRADNWREAYRTAQDRSFGESFALAVGTRDVRDQAEVNEVMGTDAFRYTSLAADLVLGFRLDPTVLGGKAAAGARARYVVRPLRSADDVNRALKGGRVQRFLEGIEGKSAAEIRDQFFAHDAHGAVIATVLADAPDAATRKLALGALMGDVGSYRQLQRAYAPTAGVVDRLMAERLSLVQFQEGTLFSQPERLATVDAELRALYPVAQRQARLERAVEWEAALTAVPKAPNWQIGPLRVPAPNAIRTGITRSDFYQASPLAAPLRATFNMVPHRWVNLHAASGDVQVARLLRESPLSVEDQDRWRSAYMAAGNPTQRQLVLAQIEDRVVRSFAGEAGMTPAEVESLLSKATTGRRQATQILNTRAYDGKGRSAVRFVDDDGLTHEINLPLFVTQEQNFFVLPDVQQLKKITSRVGRFRLRHPSTEIPGSLAESFDRIWRPSVLLRPAWPIRVVGDEQLRIFAKIGAVAQLRYLSYLPGAVAEKAQRTAAKAAKAVGLVDEVPEATRLRIGERAFAYRGYELQAAYGPPGDAANSFRDMNSAQSTWRAMSGIDDDEANLLAHLRERTGEFRTKTPDVAGYGQDWERAVNEQFAKDPIGRRILQGEPTDSIVDWLRTTDEGKALADRFSFRAGEDPTAWVNTMAEVIDDYTVGDRNLRALALAGKARVKDLVAIAPDAAQRPLVHGEVVAQLTGTSLWRDTVRGVVDKSFEVLGQKPTDVLSRNPFFDHTYRAELRRLIDVHDTQHAGRLTEKQLRGMERKARNYALRESKELLYDLAEENHLSAMLKHYVPFLSATQEVATRWAGLAVENPAFLARVRQVWNAPERAGVVTDENGNIVNPDGTATNALTGERVAAGKDRYLNMQLAPDLVQNVLEAVPGARRLADSKFNKLGMNLALQGPPTPGPIIQLPLNQLILDRPDLEDDVEFLLPMGTTPSIRDFLLSSSVRHAWNTIEGEENRTFVNNRNMIFDAARVDYMLGKRDTPPTWQEATKEARALGAVRVGAALLAPVAPSFQSPYQMFIDAYRLAQTRLRDDPLALADEHGNPRTADEWFLDTYGEAYFPLTESLSKSNDGVAPTEEGFVARKKYEDLIEAHPELGGLILGNEGAGEYAGAVYDYQLSHAVRPGSGLTQRETPSFEEHVAGPDVRRGWVEYRRVMDLIDAERIQRGLPNLQVRGASDLAAIKRGFIDELAQRNPVWFAEFGNTDRNAWARRIAGLRAVADSTQFADRPDRQDIAGLRDYLQARDLVLAELSHRKAKTLTAASNRDLAQDWESIKAALVEQNLAFGALFYRWLENDPMRLDDAVRVAA